MERYETDVRKLHDISKPDENDPLATDATTRLARKIMDTIRDPKMHPTIAMKAARAVVDRKLPPTELAEALDSVTTKRASGGFTRSAGAYFVTILKRLFAWHEIPW